MTKEEFNMLSIQEQIQIINKMLVNQSLSAIGKDIGISEATLRTRFKKGGYSRVENKFIQVTNIDANNTTNTRAIEPIKNKIDINALHNKIKSLEARLLKVENTINTSNANTDNTINTTVNPGNNTGNNIKVTQFKGETVSRAYRLDKEVQEQFKVFCRKHGEHRVQDLISSALLEYMKNNS